MNFVSAYANAYMAGLVSKDQRNTPPDQVEFRGDLTSLMQFAKLMIDDYELDKSVELAIKENLSE